MDKICVVFICQKGELEVKASLLAASLRYYETQPLELVAAVPDPAIWGDLAPQTLDLLKELKVRVVEIDSPFGAEYPIGNKLAALSVNTRATTTVFLDSDILCTQGFDSKELLTEGVSAKPADLKTFDDLDSWHCAYQQFSIDVPTVKVKSTVTAELMLPYFNAGVVAVKNAEAFSRCWLEVAQAIDSNAGVKNKRPWLDQIALPIAAKLSGRPLFALSERFNYPAHLKPLSEAEQVLLCHYHSPSVIEKEPKLLLLLASLLNRFDGLRVVLEKTPDWSPLLQRVTALTIPKKSKPRLFATLFAGLLARVFAQSPAWLTQTATVAAAPDVLLTGMPRSGTSLLCSLLSKANNTVVINEPQEVFEALSGKESGLGLRLFYRDLRARIYAGESIENKVSADGALIQDTRLDDSRRHYAPSVDALDFTLVTKNPLAYLLRLRSLCDQCPEVPKIVTIRHPYETIASWKGSFPHLSNVDLSAFPFSGLADPHLDVWQRQQLEVIEQESELSVKRALLWCFLADLMWRDRDRVTLIRYEDLLGAPQGVGSQLFKRLNIKGFKPSWVESVRKGRRLSVLSDDDFEAINLLCVKQAERYGYRLIEHCSDSV